MSGKQDPLAYGYLPGNEDSERGSGATRDAAKDLLKDTFQLLRGSHHRQDQTQRPSSSQGSNQPGSYQADPPQTASYQTSGTSPSPYAGSNQQSSYHPQAYGGQTQVPSYQQQYVPSSPQPPPSQFAQDRPPQPQHQPKPGKNDKFSGFFSKIQGTVADLSTRLGTTLDPEAYATYGNTRPKTETNRFESFAPPREHNDVKWYVDGCNYFYAVSKAIENARETIWILDWWLSPELYLRRPPSSNKHYRLDLMLQAAAERGVKVNVIVYKEVEQALTLSSAHTKKRLEELSHNIAVFRHPDHLPGEDLKFSIEESLQNLALDAAKIGTMSRDKLRSIYGGKDEMILYWAHHEKLLLIDGKIAFMGGLDLCFGRWDTHQHPIADVHPSDIDETVFPGQDYNNARVLDFQNVSQWEKNQLDRTKTSRMGWSDISICVRGPVIEDLRKHFVERWNFIYEAKYIAKGNPRYTRLALFGTPHSSGGPPSQQLPSSSQGSYQQKPGALVGETTPYYPPPPPHSSQPQAVQPQQSHSQPSWSGQTQAAPYQSSTPSGQSFPPPPPGPPPNLAQSQYPPNLQQSQTGNSPFPSGQTYGQPQYSQPQPPQTQYAQTQLPQSQHGQPQSSQPPYIPSQSPQPHYTQSQPPQSQYSQDQHPHSEQGYSQYGQQGSQPAPAPYFPPPPTQGEQYANDRGISDMPSGSSEYTGTDRGIKDDKERVKGDFSRLESSIRGRLAGQVHQYQDRYLAGRSRPSSPSSGGIECQLVRSCTTWSNGTPTEHSIANAYIAAIRNSQHFIYIENQFFITATSNAQSPVKNLIGAAIVERILRAARAGEKYKIIVVIPSVPGFAGDLKDDAALGTRAIMEYQYNAINRGGHSIMELIAKEGYNPMEYIRFYNLRNYDRINVSRMLAEIERQSGVAYEDARRGHEAIAVAGSEGYLAPATSSRGVDNKTLFNEYQRAAQQVAAGVQSKKDRWDSVSECYMLGGEDIRNVPWDSDTPEIEAFVSEELYIHTKVMIVDDRIVICGSANLNDRSQLGTHDSEMALVIDDPTPVESTINGKPFLVSRFATSLRRELFRKHLGLLRPQDYQKLGPNAEPIGVPNEFDLDAPESKVVADPLSDTFQSLWNSRARTNTEVYRQAFHVVPDDNVRNWTDYKNFYEYYFQGADKEADVEDKLSHPSKYRWGHVARENFAPGPEGAKQLKELLSKVKGTLVEMPLMFLIQEDIAKEGLTLNAFTEEIYT